MSRAKNELLIILFVLNVRFEVYFKNQRKTDVLHDIFHKLIIY